jgi:DNA-binding transcriptional regulator LsrR (DeoR family)
VAAFLYSQGKRQVDIAQQLGITQPEVSRYIARAKESGWLKVEFVESRFPGQLEDIKRLAVPPVDLLPRMHRWADDPNTVLEVQVLPSPNQRKDPKNWDGKRLPAFAEAAARHVKRLLQQARYVGVTWGETNRRVVNALCHALPRPRPKRRGLTFVPLSGEPITNPIAQLSSASTLVARLHEAINGYGEPLSLNAVPAMIPAQFEGEVGTIRAFLGWINSYREIFGEPEAGSASSMSSGGPSSARRPLVHRLDTILTGAGAPSRNSRSVWLQERLAAEGFHEIGELAELVVGDVGGCYLPRRDLGRKGVERVRGMNDRWTGIQEQHLADCAHAAARFGPGKGPPGVVIIAMGSEKADIVAECVRRGIANRFILDYDLAQSLARLLDLD